MGWIIGIFLLWASLEFLEMMLEVEEKENHHE